jgi:hypothetical protein
MQRENQLKITEAKDAMEQISCNYLKPHTECIKTKEQKLFPCEVSTAMTKSEEVSRVQRNHQ